MFSCRSSIAFVSLLIIIRSIPKNGFDNHWQYASPTLSISSETKSNQLLFSIEYFRLSPIFDLFTSILPILASPSFWPTHAIWITDHPCANFKVLAWITKSPIFPFKNIRLRSSSESSDHLYFSWIYKKYMIIQPIGNVVYRVILYNSKWLLSCHYLPCKISSISRVCTARQLGITSFDSIIEGFIGQCNVLRSQKDKSISH